MPIYEFYCKRCNTVFSFFSKRVNTSAEPPCPKCELLLARKPSTFALSRNQPEPSKPDGGTAGEADPFANMDETQMESVMESLASEAESVDENDPRQAAGIMRKLFGATGMPVAGGMEEALKRMEAGEDPEKIEAEMGDLLDGDPFAADGARGKARARRAAQRAPNVDPELYEL